MAELSKQEVKLMQLHNLGLLTPPEGPAQPQDVIQTIRQLGALQIDTIHVVARAPYFILWSRLGNYDPDWLEKTHRCGDLFEYWSHAACFIPIEEYPYFRSKMAPTNGWRLSDAWYQDHPEVIKMVLDTIHENGPTCSADFKNSKKQPGGWWNWKEEKIALENLWHRGDLMVAYRHKFHRYYDLQSNLLPDYDEKDTPSLAEAQCYWVEKTIKTLGAARPKWVADYYRLGKTETQAHVLTLRENGVLQSFHCPDWDDEILIHKDNLPLLQEARNSKLTAQHSTLLSPFDPLVWDRERTLELFDFNYSIECYLPQDQRKYGYFSLPILYKGNLVGRLDAKAHRKEQVFEIRQLHFEESFSPHQAFTHTFSRIVQDCANWHQCPQVKFTSKLAPPFL